jgi:hypothetical protein
MGCGLSTVDISDVPVFGSTKYPQPVENEPTLASIKLCVVVLYE